MSVKAKFYVTSLQSYHNAGNPEQTTVQVNLAAVNGTDEDNAQWSKWTPSGTLQMSITNPEAFKQFKGGQYVYLTLDPVE